MNNVAIFLLDVVKGVIITVVSTGIIYCISKFLKVNLKKPLFWKVVLAIYFVVQIVMSVFSIRYFFFSGPSANAEHMTISDINKIVGQNILVHDISFWLNIAIIIFVFWKIYQAETATEMGEREHQEKENAAQLCGARKNE